MRAAIDPSGLDQPRQRPAHRHLVHRGTLGHLACGQAVEARQYRHHPPLGHRDVVAALVVVRDRLADRVGQDRQSVRQEMLQLQRGMLGGGGGRLALGGHCGNVPCKWFHM
jgi:hypothetical protein